MFSNGSIHSIICLEGEGVPNECVHNFASLHLIAFLVCCKQILNYFFLLSMYLNCGEGRRVGLIITLTWSITVLIQNYFFKNIFEICFHLSTRFLLQHTYWRRVTVKRAQQCCHQQWGNEGIVFAIITNRGNGASRFTVLHLMSSAAKSQGHSCLIVTVSYYAFI